jgi:predicted DNA-binding transcriptional regulator YafY
MADLGLRQPSEAALLKLQAALPAGARERAEFARRRILIDTRGWRDPAESVALLPLVLDALWRVRKLRFLYAREGCDPAGRVGDPLGLVAKGSTWYLVARVEGEIRTYRVSRMREPPPWTNPRSAPRTSIWRHIGNAPRRSSANSFRATTPRSWSKPQ